MAKQIQRWSLAAGVILLISAALAYWVTVATPAQGSDSLTYVFACGVIAISALMLPGLSGSFMLLLLGMYQFVLHDTLKEGVLQEHDLGAVVTLGVFGLGCLLPVSSFFGWVEFFLVLPTLLLLILTPISISLPPAGYVP